MTPLMINGIVVLILILLTLVSISGHLSRSYSNNSNNYTNNKQINPHDTPLFKAGAGQAFTLVQIVLYKMWNENEILDFDNMNIDIQKHIMDLTTSPADLQKWNTKFLEYMKQKEQENKDNDI